MESQGTSSWECDKVFTVKIKYLRCYKKLKSVLWEGKEKSNFGSFDTPSRYEK